MQLVRIRRLQLRIHVHALRRLPSFFNLHHICTFLVTTRLTESVFLAHRPRASPLREEVPRAFDRLSVVHFTADRTGPGRRPSPARVALAVPATNWLQLLDIVPIRRIVRVAGAQGPMHGGHINAEDLGDRPQRQLRPRQ